MVRLHARTRVLVISDHEIDAAAETLHLAPRLIRLDARLDAVSVALIDEDAVGGRPQEVLHAAAHRVRLELAPPAALQHHHHKGGGSQRRATECHFSVGLLQIDNLLPTTSHPVALQSPSRHAGRPHGGLNAGGGGGGGGGSSSSAGSSSARARRPAGAHADAHSTDGAALRLVVRRRASGQLQDVTLELEPMDVALEASFLVRLGKLLTGGGASSERIVASLDRLARVGHAALEERLGAALATPPDWSQRVPFYCDRLLISPVSLCVSSRLDVEMGSELVLMGASSGAAAAAVQVAAPPLAAAATRRPTVAGRSTCARSPSCPTFSS